MCPLDLNEKVVYEKFLNKLLQWAQFLSKVLGHYPTLLIAAVCVSSSHNVKKNLVSSICARQPDSQLLFMK